MRGSVRRRGAGWRAVVDLPRGPDGRRRQASRTLRTRREAEAWLAATALAGSGDGWGGGRGDGWGGGRGDGRGGGRGGGGAEGTGGPAVAAFLDAWLQSVGPTLRPGSSAAYAVHVRRWQAVLGDVPLARLRPEDVQRALAALLQRLARTTVRRSLGVLRLACGAALAWGLLASDPTRGVRPPRGGEREMLCWTESQAAAFLAAVSGRTRYAACFRLALATGMRAGELLGLRWDDVDGAARTVHVARSLSWPRGGPPRLGEPKSRHSRRTIALDEGTLAALAGLRHRQEAERQACRPAWRVPGLVFTTAGGGFVRYEFLERRLRGAARAAGVPVIRLHDLRHTHATILLRQGRDVKEVAERLGHASASITLQTYAHVLPDRRSQAAEVIGRVLDGRGTSC